MCNYSSKKYSWSYFITSRTLLLSLHKHRNSRGLDSPCTYDKTVQSIVRVFCCKTARWQIFKNRSQYWYKKHWWSYQIEYLRLFDFNRVTTTKECKDWHRWCENMITYSLNSDEYPITSRVFREDQSGINILKFNVDLSKRRRYCTI